MQCFQDHSRMFCGGSSVSVLLNLSCGGRLKIVGSRDLLELSICAFEMGNLIYTEMRFKE